MISILMIVYEVEQYLRRAIESVLNQDYQDIELILVIGEGGKDNCESICREYASKDSRIKLVIAPPKGPADARNQGLKEVTGEYLGFVDADDYVEPDMFSSMMNNLNKTGADIAVCGRFYEFENKTLSDSVGEPKVYDSQEALRVILSGEGFFLHCWDKLFTKKIFEDLYFRTDIRVEDRIIVDKLISKADKIVYDSTPKYHFRERAGSLSKRSGMVRKNVEANELLSEYILSEYPGLRDECNRFMLYEYITAVQNELTSPEPIKADLKEYRGKVRDLSREKCPLVSRMIKIKSLLAVYFPVILKLYTINMKKKTAGEFVRFS